MHLCYLACAICHAVSRAGKTTPGWEPGWWGWRGHSECLRPSSNPMFSPFLYTHTHVHTHTHMHMHVHTHHLLASLMHWIISLPPLPSLNSQTKPTESFRDKFFLGALFCQSFLLVWQDSQQREEYVWCARQWEIISWEFPWVLWFYPITVGQEHWVIQGMWLWMPQGVQEVWTCFLALGLAVASGPGGFGRSWARPLLLGISDAMFNFLILFCFVLKPRGTKT
jgi:hypothetical protein